MKATSIAHPIQGLIKYHGLKDAKLRIPFHDSISVCAGVLNTTTTVEADGSLSNDLVIINGRMIDGRDRERIGKVTDVLKSMAGYSGHLKIVSRNSLVEGKGLGFSSSGFAALGLAVCSCLDLDVDRISLSEIVRLGAGSSTRSLAGSFALWYANKNGRSYAEQILDPESSDLVMIIVPISSNVKTDEAHSEVLTSPFFKTRLNGVAKRVESMKKAILDNDIASIGELAEDDTLNLHAITMTGKSRMVLWKPDTVRIIEKVREMRCDEIPAWYSIDTGPSVFINTLKEHSKDVMSRLQELKLERIVLSGIGDKPSLTSKHLL